jgi:TfoX/Sxy family transcriptional regulator of competence genes
MAYDQGLAQRLREAFDGERGVTEKEMFGGLCFLVDGKMFVGIVGDDLMVRVGPEAHEAALARDHVRAMDFTGRPMKGYVYVDPAGIEADEALVEWTRLSLQFVATLPAKGAKAEKAPAKGAKAKSPKPGAGGGRARKG